MNIKKKITSSPGNGLNIFVNPYSLYILMREKFDFDIVDNILIDGGLLVLFLKLFKGVDVKRVSFDYTSYADTFFEGVSQGSSRLAIIGSEQEKVETFIKLIKLKYPQLNISTYRNGFFTNSEKRRSYIIDFVNNHSSDFVVVGMGTPLQENFAADLKRMGFEGTIFTCGGFIHQTQETIDYYPKLLNKLQLRFLWRIIKEKGLLQRYLGYYPKALFYIYRNL